MPMRTTDTLIGPARGTDARAIAFATSEGASRLGEATAYVREVYRAAPSLGLDPAIVVSQSVHETTDGGNPWASSWWVNRLNPAGIGITGDPVENAASYTWPNGTEAARSHLAHLRLYTTGINDTGWYDPREQAYLDAYGHVAIAETIADLAGTWAVDPRYAEGICAKSAWIYPNLPDQTGGAVSQTTIPGLPGGPLLTDYPIRQNLMALDGFRRPGTKATRPRRSVQHGTGNPSNASAMAEAQYFVNGAEGRQASVHACSDDTEVVIVVPLDEVTWQAADGAGPGNMCGLSCEMMEADAIWNNASRRDKLIAITADFMGRCAARLAIANPEKHYDFNAGTADRHYCPNKLMSTGLWDSSYAPKWRAAKADELARMAGNVPTTTTTTTASPYPTHRIPAPDTMSAQGHKLRANASARFTCTHGGTFKTAPSRDAPNAATSPYRAGKDYTFDYGATVDGEEWLVSKSGSWALRKNFTRKDATS